MATNIPFSRELSQNVRAIQKRNYHTVQREKRRRTFFIHDYIRTKYPGIYTEANGMYQMFVDKYPHKADFTKTYYFRKWQKSMDQRKSTLMMPHLPILTSLQQLTTGQEEQVQQPEEQVQQSEEQVQQPEEQVQQPEEQVQQPEEQVQQPEEQVQQPKEQVREEVSQSGVQIQSDQFPQMSLEEINRAVQHIVEFLQNDELEDILLDLPEDVWQNELRTPDYVLEDELEW